MTPMSSTKCASCTTSLEGTPPGQPCQVCGATARVLVRVVSDEVRVLDGYAFKQLCPSNTGKRKVAAEGFSRHEPSRRAALVHHERVIDRRNDKYREVVVDADTGVVLHRDEGRLSEHRGHGSAKSR